MDNYKIEGKQYNKGGEIRKCRIIDSDGFTWWFGTDHDRGLYLVLSPDEDVDENGYWVDNLDQALQILRDGGYI